MSPRPHYPSDAGPRKRFQTASVLVRLRPTEAEFLAACLEKLATDLAKTSPEAKVSGLSPFFRTAAIRRAEQILGVSFLTWEKQQTKKPSR